MSQVTEQSVRFQTALASITLIQASAVLDLTEDDFDFLTSNKVWIATDRSRARRCVEACFYGTLDFVGYPFFFSSRRRHTRLQGDWSSDVCSSDLQQEGPRLRARNPGAVQLEGGARALEGPAARDQGQGPPLQRRPAVLQQALHRAGGRDRKSVV